MFNAVELHICRIAANRRSLRPTSSSSFGNFPEEFVEILDHSTLDAHPFGDADYPRKTTKILFSQPVLTYSRMVIIQFLILGFIPFDYLFFREEGSCSQIIFSFRSQFKRPHSSYKSKARLLGFGTGPIREILVFLDRSYSMDPTKCKWNSCYVMFKLCVLCNLSLNNIQVHSNESQRRRAIINQYMPMWYKCRFLKPERF